MKKTLLALIMSVIMIGLASCGGNGGHSKAFNDCKKIMDDMKTTIENAETCDDVDMATLGILALFGVEGLENMAESEQEELSKLSDEIDKVMEAKKAELNCPEDELFGDDEDMPMDEWFEEDSEVGE